MLHKGIFKLHIVPESENILQFDEKKYLFLTEISAAVDTVFLTF